MPSQSTMLLGLVKKRKVPTTAVTQPQARHSAYQALSFRRLFMIKRGRTINCLLQMPLEGLQSYPPVKDFSQPGHPSFAIDTPLCFHSFKYARSVPTVVMVPVYRSVRIRWKAAEANDRRSFVCYGSDVEFV